MEARIERGITGATIVITGLKDMRPTAEDHIFDSIVEHCCQSLSTNELKEIVRQIEVGQLGRLNPCDIPPIYQKMLNEVKEVIRKRTGECAERPIRAYRRSPCCYPCCYPCCCPPRETTKKASGFPGPSNRPYFGPKQVRYMSQLKRGQVYYDIGKESGRKTRFVVKNGPYLENGKWWMLVEVYGPAGYLYATNFSLADHGVVPYENGDWHPSHYIIFGRPPCSPQCHPDCCPRETTKRKALEPDISTTRPYFGHDQVRCASQLKRGQAYYAINTDYPVRTRFVITREPYLDRGTWWIDVEAYSSFGKHKETYSLADHSVVPYEAPYKGNVWNTRNYIIFGEPCSPQCCPDYCPRYCC